LDAKGGDHPTAPAESETEMANGFKYYIKKVEYISRRRRVVWTAEC
jgi:hypothetical protein